MHPQSQEKIPETNKPSLLQLQLWKRLQVNTKTILYFGVRKLRFSVPYVLKVETGLHFLKTNTVSRRDPELPQPAVSTVEL
jgi:hypothetical protein